MNVAALAADRASWMHDVMLAKARSQPPPKKRIRPQPAQPGAQLGIFSNSNGTPDIRIDPTVQRALRVATQRLAALDRRAKLLHLVGLEDAALRLEGVARSIREVLE